MWPRLPWNGEREGSPLPCSTPFPTIPWSTRAASPIPGFWTGSSPGSSRWPICGAPATATPAWQAWPRCTLHERHHLTLIAWVAERRDVLDRIVADARSGSRGPRDAWDGYSRGFRRALARPVRAHAHLRVIEDVVESLDDLLPAAERERLGELAEGYRTGHVPRRVLLAAVREQVERSAPQLVSQAYLDPYPPELAQLEGGRLTL